MSSILPNDSMDFSAEGLCPDALNRINVALEELKEKGELGAVDLVAEAASNLEPSEVARLVNACITAVEKYMHPTGVEAGVAKGKKTGSADLEASAWDGVAYSLLTDEVLNKLGGSGELKSILLRMGENAPHWTASNLAFRGPYGIGSNYLSSEDRLEIALACIRQQAKTGNFDDSDVVSSLLHGCFLAQLTELQQLELVKKAVSVLPWAACETVRKDPLLFLNQLSLEHLTEITMLYATTRVKDGDKEELYGLETLRAILCTPELVEKLMANDQFTQQFLNDIRKHLGKNPSPPVVDHAVKVVEIFVGPNALSLEQKTQFLNRVILPDLFECKGIGKVIVDSLQENVQKAIKKDREHWEKELKEGIKIHLAQDLLEGLNKQNDYWKDLFSQRRAQ